MPKLSSNPLFKARKTLDILPLLSNISSHCQGGSEKQFYEFGRYSYFHNDPLMKVLCIL